MKHIRFKRFIGIHLLPFAVLFIYIISGMYSLTLCPVLIIFSLPCPCCGVTRAITALIRLDFTSYVEANIMAPFLCSAVLLFLHRRPLGDPKWIDVYVYSVLTVNTVYYAVRLAMGFRG